MYIEEILSQSPRDMFSHLVVFIKINRKTFPLSLFATNPMPIYLESPLTTFLQIDKCVRLITLPKRKLKQPNYRTVVFEYMT